MKTTPVILKFGFIMLLLMASADFCLAQGSKKERDSIQAAKISALVAEQQYTFFAQSASPTKGGLIQLNPGYTVVVKKDTVTSDLPYYGRAYQAGYGSNDGGIKFTSLSYDYKVTPRKKDGWNISIKPKDASNFRELLLTVYSDGSASLNVNCNDRQPISYRGYISDKK